ncbi:Proline dehydrogenase [Lysinibacillus sphaericus]|uniref:Proline dehydrogenase n=1 Tax=Lysinibacillus sphaericus TaxID=1421 RepID=A0AAJ5A6K0_LYSSH|nr:Proline dehydrogenase [Lysinibacillus sphaericus]
MKKPQELVMEALKSAARNNQMKDAFQQSKELYPLLLKAAKRYVAGEVRADAIAGSRKFISERLSSFTGVYRRKYCAS